MSLRHRRGYAVDLHHALPATETRAAQKFSHPAVGYAPHPTRIRQIQGRSTIKGRKRRFLAYSFSSR